MIRGASEQRGQTVGAAIFVLDDAEVWHHTNIPVELDQSGNGSTKYSAGLGVGRHSAVYVHGIEHNGRFVPFRSIAVSIANSPDPGADEDLVRQYQELRASQDALYEVSLGANDAGQSRFRALAFIEGLLLTKELRVPGARVRPISSKTSDQERLRLVNAVLQDLGWVTRVPENKWVEYAERSSHFAIAVAPDIHADNFDSAGAVALDHFQKIVSLMAINRGATGRIVATVLEQEPIDGTTNYRVLPPPHTYTGNMIGGLIAGESDREITTKFLGIDADPLVRLCCDLYAEALAERSADAKYLRMWSILEVLSGARIDAGVQVKLSDGSRWPGKHYTTNHAAPRVYEYLRTIARNRSTDEDSLGRPAQDLPHAVRSWYARRNATGHYGRFVADDAAQKTQGWYANALATLTDGWEWLSSLERIVEMTISYELRAMAASKGFP